jgi:hypothetical protein
MALRTEPQTPGPLAARQNAVPRSPVVALDVTGRFNDAASALKTGQLVKQDDFTLFEAVSALEVRARSIMVHARLISLKVLDPKMDQGFGEDLEDEYDVSRPLLPEEVIGIMDQTLCLEVRQNRTSRVLAALRLHLNRLAGTSASPCRKLYSHPSTLIDSYGLSLEHWKKLNSIQLGGRWTDCHWFS